MELFLEENIKVPFETKHLDTALSIPVQKNAVDTAVVLTHGAGGDMNFKHLVSLAHWLASSGVLCIRFTCKGLNLAYRVRAYSAVVKYLTKLKKFPVNNILLGGRSMGARAAVAVARQLCTDDSMAVRGLLCLTFPLHPPGQTHAHTQRSEDLRALSHTPVLFVSGTADNMCERNLLETVREQMKAPSSVYWVEGASHGLTVKGRTEESVLAEINTNVTSWIQETIDGGKNALQT